MRELPQTLPREPDLNFGMVTARLRRLAGADNRAIARCLSIPERTLHQIDDGRVPDYPTGCALIRLLQHIGGDLQGLTRNR